MSCWGYKMIDSIQKRMKAKADVNSIDEAIDELKYLTIGYPKAAVRYVIEHKEEATPKLLDLLRYVVENYESLDKNYFGHLHAMFILSKFREQQAFDLIVAIAKLPDDWPDILLGDLITEDLHCVLASVYNGNLQALKNIVEDPRTYVWSRSAALNSLLILFKLKMLKRDEVIDYFKTLFEHTTFANDEGAATSLVAVSRKLYPKELFNEIKQFFEDGNVDDWFIDIDDIKDVIALDQKTALEKFIYTNPYYSLIDDATYSMEGWCCFDDYHDRDRHLDYSFENYDYPETSIPVNTFRRDMPKIGRNEPCPCGSGEKYKKCCLNQNN